MDAHSCESMLAMMNHMGGMPMTGRGVWLWMVIAGLVLIAVVVAVVVIAVRTGASGRDGGSDALRELDVRYARGELDRDDYLQRRQDLERG